MRPERKLSGHVADVVLMAWEVIASKLDRCEAGRVDLGGVQMVSGFGYDGSSALVAAFFMALLAIGIETEEPRAMTALTTDPRVVLRHDEDARVGNRESSQVETGVKIGVY